MNESDTSRHFLRQWIEKDVAAGTTGGKVVTRFPPEPNGYIHIGHAKAVCVDFGMAQLFNGECHLRLDDTNPTKESDEYAENIRKDINWLGFHWSGEGDAGEPGFYNASNMFDKMYEIAENLIRAGQAYCCNLTQEEWKEYRGVPEKPGSTLKRGVGTPFSWGYSPNLMRIGSRFSRHPKCTEASRRVPLNEVRTQRARKVRGFAAEESVDTGNLVGNMV